MWVGPEPAKGSAASSESMFQPLKEYRVIDRVKRRPQIQGDQDVGLLGVNSSNKSLVIVSSAVSVEWCWRYVD